MALNSEIAILWPKPGLDVGLAHAQLQGRGNCFLKVRDVVVEGVAIHDDGDTTNFHSWHEPYT
jgi:hypothetical protein